jgi:muconolactone delta-isomerase
MLFHVSITVRVPHDVDAETIKQMSAKEHERALGLTTQSILPSALSCVTRSPI